MLSFAFTASHPSFSAFGFKVQDVSLAEHFLALDDQFFFCSRALRPDSIPSLKSTKDKEVIQLSIDGTRRASLVREGFRSRNRM
jgi:hypothetical protein